MEFNVNLTMNDNHYLSFEDSLCTTSFNAEIIPINLTSYKKTS